MTAFAGVAITLVGGIGEALATSPSDRMTDWYYTTGYFLFGGMLLATVGSILLGIMTIRVGMLSWWCGVALITGSPLLAFAMAPLGGAAWVLVGYSIFRAAVHQAEQPSRVR